MKKQTLNYSTATPLPNNFLAEESVLNILLTTTKLIRKSIASLKSESFYYEPHKIIYETLLKLENQNKVCVIFYNNKKILTHNIKINKESKVNFEKVNQMSPKNNLIFQKYYVNFF